MSITINSWGWTSSQNITYNAILDEPVITGENVNEPVIRQEAKDWCRIDHTYDDAIIDMLIPAARKICEDYSNIGFITRTIAVRIDNSLGGSFLPLSPVNGGITTIKDEDGLDIISDNYSIKNSMVYTPFDKIINVVYNAGYSMLPSNLKVALLQQIAFMYESRGDQMPKPGTTGLLSPAAKMILQGIRRVI